ncbi:transglycosylase domain-containing protein [Eubacterium sp.]|uniref:transglycosylase domain-containing protein n=1 Tax=Eubacterium sp. TaxID=142586 RepID=UPI0025F08B8B|nr:transglycosylase domain-containing protein [Eubacterium sp.]MCR5629648.1 transglycosylase domain-containing protein [Eubacterium sp.]
MNFTYKKTVEKQRELVSLQSKFSTKSLITILKLGLFCSLFIVAFLTSFGIGTIKGIIDNAPDLKSVNIAPNSYQSKAYNTDGKEIVTLITAGSNRIYAKIDEIPDNLKNAFVDIEDERFYEHNGIDIQGIGRAAVQVFKTKSLSQGASTITQQVIKNNVFAGLWEGNQTYGSLIRRKIQEQYLAVKLEKELKKEEILESYLNTINLGSNTLGVQAAAHRYFNKDVKDLNLAECTVIAAITQNPAYLEPIHHSDENNVRRTTILQYMLKNGHITQEEYDEAINFDYSKNILEEDPNRKSYSEYTYFVDQLISDILNDLQVQKGYTYTQAYQLLYSGGLKIYSTQDSKIQEICDKELSNDANYPATIKYSFNWAFSVKNLKDGTIENYSENSIKYYHRVTLEEQNFKLIFSSKKECRDCVKKYKKYLFPKGIPTDSKDYRVLGETISYTKQPQASFTVIDQSTGYVKAIVGGRGKKSGNMTLNRATQSKRQPGSTFKVVGVYAPAIDEMGYTLKTKMDNSRYSYANGRAVSNWDGHYGGSYSIKQAIAQSMNIIAVRTLTDIGVEKGFDKLKEFGITTLVEDRVLQDGTVLSDKNQALALGGITDGVTNLELTAAYAAIANNGVYNKPVLYTQVVDSSGLIILDNTTPKSHKVIKAGTAAQLTEAMEEVVNGHGTAGDHIHAKDLHVAGKTGTTSSQYDLWFVGFTPYLTAGVWFGYDENSDLGNGTIFFHEDLWSKIMDQVTDEFKYKDKPFEFDLSGDDDVVGIEVCKESGLLPNGDACKETEIKYFPNDDVPTKKCNKHGVQRRSYSSENNFSNSTTDESRNNNNNGNNSNNSNNSNQRNNNSNDE